VPAFRVKLPSAERYWTVVDDVAEGTTKAGIARW
jgi:hypothetical protein